MAKQLDLLLHLDDRRVRDDPERRIEKIAHLGVAIFARLFPERRDDVVVAARQLACARRACRRRPSGSRRWRPSAPWPARIADRRRAGRQQWPLWRLLFCRIGRSGGAASAGFQPIANSVALGGLPGGTIRDAQKAITAKHKAVAGRSSTDMDASVADKGTENSGKSMVCTALGADATLSEKDQSRQTTGRPRHGSGAGNPRRCCGHRRAAASR